jgi:hypothetical protein
MNSWKTWWVCLFTMAAIYGGVSLQVALKARDKNEIWAKSQWAVQPTYTVPVCRAHAVDCKVLANWEVETFFYFPSGQVCPIQTKDGDCADNWWMRPHELQAMEEFFFQTCWVQPGRFPPWWRIIRS